MVETCSAIFTILFIISILTTIVATIVFGRSEHILKHTKWCEFPTITKHKARIKTTENILIVSIVCDVIFGFFIFI